VNLELRHLRYFLTVAEEKHFGRAAKRLHIVQPALSMQIRSLEEELGTALFTRTTRHVDLTSVGLLLRVEAERAVAQAERAKEVVQRAARGEIGSLRIGFCGSALLGGELVKVMNRFRTKYPEVTLELREMHPLLQSDAIVAGRLDIGLCPVRSINADPQLTAHQISAWPWVVAMERGHPLAKKKSLSADSLTTAGFILYGTDGEEEYHLNVLQQLLGRDPHIVQHVTGALTVLALAAAGLGIALVPEPLRMVPIPNIIYKPLEESKCFANLVLLSRSNDRAGAVGAFLRLAQAGLPATAPPLLGLTKSSSGSNARDMSPTTLKSSR
jgi:DNA-binding transcriptional LysR family regulator